MTKLSVNINKIATLRNSRGGNTPNVLQTAIDCQRFGADGITIHPRPDQRHIRYQDAIDIKKIITTEYNIEGNPKHRDFVDLVLTCLPTQVTLVPDTEGQLTSDHGWDTIKEKDFLKEIILEFKSKGIRVSIFVNPDENMMLSASETGTDRIELYTEAFAKNYKHDPYKAIQNYISSSISACSLGLGINAGHDLSLENLKFFSENIPQLDEVSIGHALISDALYFGLENTIQMYKRLLV